MKKEKETRHLIELLMAGEITPEEQRRLKELLSDDDLANDLVIYREMMDWMERPLPVPDNARPRQRRRLLRIAAMLAFMVCIGAMAAIGYSSGVSESSGDSEVTEVSESYGNQKAHNTVSPKIPEDITFDNVPLAEIAKQMSETFNCTVVFADKAAETIRLYFTISKGSTVADFVTIIDDYDALTATLKDNTITIRLQEEQQ